MTTAAEDNAASKMQAMFRGKQARSQVQEKRVERKFMEMAATKIQARFRGKQARVEVKKKRVEKEKRSQGMLLLQTVHNANEEGDEDGDDLRDAIDMDFVQNEALMSLEQMVRKIGKAFNSLVKQTDERYQALKVDLETEFREQLAANETRAAKRVNAAEARAAAAEARAETAERSVAAMAEEHIASKASIRDLTHELKSLASRTEIRFEEQHRLAEVEQQAAEKQRIRVLAHDKLFEDVQWRLKMLEESRDAVALSLQSEVNGASIMAQQASSQFDNLQRELHHKFSDVKLSTARSIDQFEKQWESDARQQKQSHADLRREIAELRESISGSVNERVRLAMREYTTRLEF